MKIVYLPILVLASSLLVEPVCAFYESQPRAQDMIRSNKGISTINFKIINSQIKAIVDNEHLSVKERARFLNDLLHMQTASLAQEMNAYSSVARSLKASSDYLTRTQSSAFSERNISRSVSETMLNGSNLGNLSNKYQSTVANNTNKQDSDSLEITVKDNSQIDIEELSNMLRGSDSKEQQIDENLITSLQEQEKQQLDLALGFNKSLVSTTTQTLNKYTNDLQELIRSDLSETSALEFSSDFDLEASTECDKKKELEDLENCKEEHDSKTLKAIAEKPIKGFKQNLNHKQDNQNTLSKDSSLEDLSLALSGIAIKETSSSNKVSNEYDLAESIKNSLQHNTDVFEVAHEVKSDDVAKDKDIEHLATIDEDMFFSFDEINRRAEAQAYLDSKAIIAQRKYQYDLYQKSYRNDEQLQVVADKNDVTDEQVVNNVQDPCLIAELEAKKHQQEDFIHRKEFNKNNEPSWITQSPFLRFNEIAMAQPLDSNNYVEHGHSWSNSATKNGAFTTQAYEFNNKYPFSSTLMKSKFDQSNSARYLQLSRQHPVVIEDSSVFSPESNKSIIDAVCIPEKVRSGALPVLQIKKEQVVAPNNMQRFVDQVDSQLSVNQTMKSLDAMYINPKL